MAARKRVSEARSFAAKAFKLQRSKAKATIAPVARPGDLRGIWDREFGVYRVRIVEVLGRTGSRLTFALVGNPKGYNEGGPFTLDLDDGHLVWGDLPSTAQLVDPASRKRIGYLLLNENWLRENVGVREPPAPEAARAVTLAATSGTGGTEATGMGDGPKVPATLGL
jgi:hypothetical protein